MTLLACAAVIVGGVAAVNVFLGSRPDVAPNACTAVLPDGTPHSLSAEQADNAALIAAIADARGLPARAATIALATAQQESQLINLDYGDRDSVGLFQQRPSQGWGDVEQIVDPVYAAGAFYDALVQISGYEGMEITQAAQEVQRSAFPEAYSAHEQMARAFASALTGHSEEALTCDLTVLDSPAPAADLRAALADRLARDFGAETTTAVNVGGTDYTRVDAAPLVAGADANQAAWAVGQWAVATASVTGASLVVVGDLAWERGTDGWAAADSALAQEPGVVLAG